MADRIIVASFDDQSAAYGAARAIRTLDGEHAGLFKLKAGVVVRTDAEESDHLLGDLDRRPTTALTNARHGRSGGPSLVGGLTRAANRRCCLL